MTLVELYAEFKTLGALPALAIVLVYVHGFVQLRPLVVRVVTIVEAVRIKLGISDDDLSGPRARAEAEVPRPDVGSLVAGIRVLEGGAPVANTSPPA